MKIITFEEHGEVLNFWRSRNLNNETIIIFDQHLDFKRIPSYKVEYTKKCLSEGLSLAKLNRNIPFEENNKYTYGLDSFLCLAGELSLIKKLIWVMPEVEPIAIEEIATKVLNLISLIPYEGENIARSFHIGQYSIRFYLGCIEVHVTTLSRLTSLKDLNDARIDIDLDYFADSLGNKLTDVELFINIMKDLNLYERIETMTFSISSGFLPESHRYLAETIAKGRSMESAARSCHPAKHSIEIFSTNKNIDYKIYHKVAREELELIGGAGYSLRAILALQIPDIIEAIKSYEMARLMGDTASLAAYRIGMWYYTNKNYELSNYWFSKAANDYSDTLHLHSQCLRILSLSRLGQWQEVYNLGSELLKIIPLRKQLYDLVSLAGEKTEIKHEAKQELQATKQRILNLISTGAT